MNELTQSRLRGPMVLLLPCLECGDALEIQGDCTGLHVTVRDLDEHGWVLSLISPLEAPQPKVAPLCGGCAEKVYGAELEPMRQRMRQHQSTTAS